MNRFIIIDYLNFKIFRFEIKQTHEIDERRGKLNLGILLVFLFTPKNGDFGFGNHFLLIITSSSLWFYCSFSSRILRAHLSMSKKLAKINACYFYFISYSFTSIFYLKIFLIILQILKNFNQEFLKNQYNSET